MFTNGKFEGDDDAGGQMNAQVGLSAFPSLFVKHFDRALLIGLGTGHSAATLKDLGYRDIDIAEFSQESCARPASLSPISMRAFWTIRIRECSWRTGATCC
jgi:hypothetical protein